MRPLTPKRERQARIVSEYIEHTGPHLDYQQSGQLRDLLGLTSRDSLRATLVYLRFTETIDLPKITVATKPYAGRKVLRREYDRPMKSNQGSSNKTCPRCQELNGWTVYLTADGRHTYCAQCAWYPGWELTLCSGV